MNARVRPHINDELCNGCKACALACPMQVIQEDDGKFTLLKGTVCEDCSVCYGACPTKAISLIEETHKNFFGVQDEMFGLPAIVLVKAYLYKSGDRNEAMRGYLDRVSAAGLDVGKLTTVDASRFLFEHASDGVVRYYRQDLSADHFTEQVWMIGQKTEVSELNNGSSGLIELTEPANEKFTDLAIILLDGPIERDVAVAQLGVTRPYGSKLFNDTVLAYSSYYPDGAGRENYILTPARQEQAIDLQKLLPDIVENVIEIENSFHLLQRSRMNYQTADSNLSKIEGGITKKTRSISQILNDASVDQMKVWLQDLTSVYSKIAMVNAEIRELTMNARMHQLTLEYALNDRGEGSIAGFTQLSIPLNKNIQIVGQEGAMLSERLKALRSEVGDVIAILRTRTNLVIQEQSLALQKARNRTAQSQFKMQKSIEGLYIFIVAYYLTALVKILLEATESAYGLPFTVIQGTAAFIPFALLIGFFLSGKLKEFLNKRRRKRGLR